MPPSLACMPEGCGGAGSVVEKHWRTLRKPWYINMIRLRSAKEIPIIRSTSPMLETIRRSDLMSSAQSMPADSVTSQRDAFIERFFQFASGTFSMFSIYIGDRLGLYRALAEGGPATSKELAGRTGTHERYIREWLEQQTVAGILEVENENHAKESRRFSIPA